MALRKKNDPSRGKPGVIRTLDLSQPAHWDFLGERLARAGVTPKNARKLFGALESARDEGSGPNPEPASGDALVPLNAITSLGFSAEGTFAGGFSAIPGGTIFTSLILELIDPTDGNVLATTTLTEYGLGEYLPIAIEAGRPSGDQIEAILTVSYQTGTGRPVTQTVRMVANNGADGSPSVRQPVQKRHDLSPDLRIALGAIRPMPRYDYWYRSVDISRPDLRLPLVGQQRFRSPIAATPKDIAVYLIAPTRGGVAMAGAASVKALRRSLKVAGRKLSWSMPWSADPGRDASLHFGNAAWGEESVLLVCTISVQLKKSDAPVLVTICSSVPVSPDVAYGQPGVATIPPIDYFWR